MSVLYQISADCKELPSVTSHEEINDQSQQGCSLVVITVAGHEKQQNNDQQITRVEILRQDPPKKAGCVGVLAAVRYGLGFGRLRWWRRRGPQWLRHVLVSHTVFLKRTVRLGNITVVQGFHLPDRNGIPLGSRLDAAPARRAERMAFSSFCSRCCVK